MLRMRIFTCFILTVLLAGYAYTCQAWGFWAHRHINRAAVDGLPEGMKKFYVNYADHLSSHAVDPDKRRYCYDDEAPHHFIDLDHYGPCPFEAVPHRWADAVAKYSKDTLDKYGTLPWHIYLVYYDLVHAFMDRNPDRILQLSADLGHYLADSYVPLHTTVNYDGQLTGQEGIHSLWESTIPEIWGDGYDAAAAPAKYISAVNEYIWKGCLKSAAMTDSVLTLEKKLMNKMPLSQRLCIDQKRSGKPVVQLSDTFICAYNKALNGMVARQYTSSITAVRNLWMSAWVDAGQPELDSLIGKTTDEQPDTDTD